MGVGVGVGNVIGYESSEVKTRLSAAMLATASFRSTRSASWRTSEGAAEHDVGASWLAESGAALCVGSHALVANEVTLTLTTVP